MAPIAGVSLLNRVLQRVWEVNQSASVRSQEEYELGSIVLRLLAQTLDTLRGVTSPYLPLGVTSGKERLDGATYKAFGCGFDKWRERTMLRISAREWELARCIPDYDPQQALASKAEGRREVHTLPEQRRERENGRRVGMRLVPAQAGRKTGTLP